MGEGFFDILKILNTTSPTQTKAKWGWHIIKKAKKKAKMRKPQWNRETNPC